MNPQTAKGIDWSATLANQHVNFGNNAFDRTGSPLNQETTRQVAFSTAHNC